MLEIPTDWVQCAKNPVFVEAQEVMFEAAIESQEAIQREFDLRIEKAFVEKAGPKNIVPLLGLEHEDEAEGYMDLYLSGYFRFPKKEKQESVKRPYNIPAKSLLLQLEPGIALDAIGRLSHAQMMACVQFVYAARLDKKEWEYGKIAKKKNGSLEKMLRIQRRMDLLQKYYQGAIEQLLSQE